MTAPDGLFAEPERPPEPAALPKAQRDRERWEKAMAAGHHPLSVPLRIPLMLHTDASPDLGSGKGLRCGTCRFRRLTSGGNRSFPKCTADPIPRSNVVDGRTYRWDDHPRATHGTGTDVRRYWPACRDYQPEQA